MRIKLWANGGLANTNREEYHEVPEDEWNSMTKDEQEVYLQECADAFMVQCGIEWGAYVEGEDR